MQALDEVSPLESAGRPSRGDQGVPGWRRQGALRHRRHRAGQARLTMGYFPIGPRTSLSHRRAVWKTWAQHGGNAGIRSRSSPPASTTAPGLGFPGSRGLPEQETGHRLPRGVRSSLRVTRPRLDTHVRRLGLDDSGGFVIETDGGTIGANLVVVATGPFQRPFLPDWHFSSTPNVHQAHSVEYRKPSEVPMERSALVGGTRGPDHGRTVIDARRGSCGWFAANPLPQRILVETSSGGSPRAA